MFEINQNGKWSIKLATIHLHAFAHAISQKRTVGSRSLELNTMTQSVSSPPAVMVAAALGRNSADTRAAPEKSSVSKLLSMRSPFRGSKKRKVPDP